MTLQLVVEGEVVATINLHDQARSSGAACFELLVFESRRPVALRDAAWSAWEVSRSGYASGARREERRACVCERMLAMSLGVAACRLRSVPVRARLPCAQSAPVYTKLSCPQGSALIIANIETYDELPLVHSSHRRSTPQPRPTSSWLLGWASCTVRHGQCRVYRCHRWLAGLQLE